MIKLQNLIDLDELDDMIKRGYVSSRHHPTLPYRILNYTKDAAADYVWNNTTETCRGLIVDDDDNVIARPFRKFYNYSELIATGRESDIPTDEKFTIYDKLDGCLGILFYTPDGELEVSTRGSMTSPQSDWAAEYLRNTLSTEQKSALRDMICERVGDKYMQKVTLCFEIIYKGERHVVNYNGEESVTLLAVLNNETGKDLPLDSYTSFFKTPMTFNCDWEDVKKVFPRKNAEGFVVKFENGFRMKIKYEEFLNAQKIVHGLTFKRMFKAISNKDLLSIVPYISSLEEETILYVKSQLKELVDAYFDIEFDTLLEYENFDDEREAAEHFKTKKDPAVLFCARKGQDYSKLIWKRVKSRFKEKEMFAEDEE